MYRLKSAFVVVSDLLQCRRQRCRPTISSQRTFLHSFALNVASNCIGTSPTVGCRGGRIARHALMHASVDLLVGCSAKSEEKVRPNLSAAKLALTNFPKGIDWPHRIDFLMTHLVDNS